MGSFFDQHFLPLSQGDTPGLGFKKPSHCEIWLLSCLSKVSFPVWANQPNQIWSPTSLGKFFFGEGEPSLPNLKSNFCGENFLKSNHPSQKVSESSVTKVWLAQYNMPAILLNKMLGHKKIISYYCRTRRNVATDLVCWWMNWEVRRAMRTEQQSSASLILSSSTPTALRTECEYAMNLLVS